MGGFWTLAEIINENKESFKLTQMIDLDNNDIFGCGLVYPPTIKLDGEKKFPYMFFTLNGKQIGKYLMKIYYVLFSYLPTRLTMRHNLRTYCPGGRTTFKRDLES